MLCRNFAVSFLITALLLCKAVFAQETRSSIFGWVLDPQATAIPGAEVTVTNTDTSIKVQVRSNETGYYEANLLLPGNYTVEAVAQGFKKAVQSGIVLTVSTRREVKLPLEIGSLSESVSVTAEAPLLNTDSVASGRVLDNRSISDLPVFGNNTMLLVKMSPGVQHEGVNTTVVLHSVLGGSSYNTAGNVGGNEWSIDGVPNTGIARSAAQLPHQDTVQEFKVETSGFDASIGHSSGINVAMMTKAGTNEIHGSGYWQHWQKRWNAAPFFVKQFYYQQIAAANANGDTALADRLRSQPIQPPGHQNTYSGTIGGPVVIPKIFDGRNKLFFFFSYNGYKYLATEEANNINFTLPTLAARHGDFSSLLNVDPARYQLYDPLSVRPDPNSQGHYIRTPIPGNILPQSRLVNPVYNFYSKLLPTPNNDPTNPRLEPVNNYVAIGIPLTWDYKAMSNRYDYHHSQKDRFFGRWSWNDFFENRGDWTFETMPGLHAPGLVRHNLGGTVDWVHTLSASTVIDVSFTANEYREANANRVAREFKPSDAGFPAYMDQKAGDKQVLPAISAAGYRAISGRGFQETLRARMLTQKLDVMHVRGGHTIRTGVDVRGHFRTGGGDGATGGGFNFSNAYTRKDDGLAPAGNYGHSWAAFMMGLPSAMYIDTTDTYAMYSPYYGWYVQDNWHVTPRLSLSFGLRAEYEQGPTERYNRMLGALDPSAVLPISEAAQAAYARNPVPERSASSFVVRGGSTYPGSGGVSRNWWQDALMWLPRVGAAYRLNSKTVVRAGFGMFYDTLNVMNNEPNQLGFSRQTLTNLTNDYGMTWLAGNPYNGVSPLVDPFPVRSDGTRFDEPVRNGLGLMAIAGRAYNNFPLYDTRHARQRRWRAGVQRQLTPNTVLEVAYAGSYSDRVNINQNLNPLAEQFWADGLVRNNAIASNLDANVRNPFQIGNFDALKTSDPAIYQNMAVMGFFTSGTIRKNQLLRQFPQITGLSAKNAPLGKARTDAMEVSLERRFSKGFNLNVAYTMLRGREATSFYNEFDALPYWRFSNSGRPHRLVATGIWELPFGKNRALLNRGGLLTAIFGGWQTGMTYELQPGPLLSWGNMFYYGNVDDITAGARTLDRWFNTDGFERTASKGPAAYHRRVFPEQIDGMRQDFFSQWNANLQRDVKLRERVTMQFRLDVLNVQNRSQFLGPELSPYSTNFGRITTQSGTVNRFLQVNARIRF